MYVYIFIIYVLIGLGCCIKRPTSDLAIDEYALEETHLTSPLDILLHGWIELMQVVIFFDFTGIHKNHVEKSQDCAAPA